MNGEPKYRRVLAMTGLLAAATLLLAGTRHVYTVLPGPQATVAPEPFIPPPFDPLRPDEPWSIPPSKPIASTHYLTDPQMVENATFTGVTRRDGALYLTYDPAKNRGKRSCPT